MKKIYVLIISLVVLFGAEAAHAAKIRINGIEIRDFISQHRPEPDQVIIPVYESRDYLIDYAFEGNHFQINILSDTYDETVKRAEETFLRELEITKNEACFLNMRIVTDQRMNADAPDFASLSYCENSVKADVNEDGVINTFDFAICLDQLDIEEEGNQSCDFNVNRRIDALDFSIVLDNIGGIIE